MEAFADVVADFRAFYHLSLAELKALSVDEFFVLVSRCVVYGGAVHWHFELELQAGEEDFETSAQRLLDGGGEVAEIPVDHSYLFDLLKEG